MGLLDILALLLFFVFLWFFALFRDFLAFLGKFRTVKSLSFRSKSLPFLLPGQSFRAKSLSLDFRGFLWLLKILGVRFALFFDFLGSKGYFEGHTVHSVIFMRFAPFYLIDPRHEAGTVHGITMLCLTSCYMARGQYYCWSKSIPADPWKGPGPVLQLVETIPADPWKGPGPVLKLVEINVAQLIQQVAAYSGTLTKQTSE